MGCGARGGCNIFWLLFKFSKYQKGIDGADGFGWVWWGRKIFRINYWRWNYKYIWHDSVGKFFNRLVKCRITDHSNTREIACDGELPKTYCFDCERNID